MCIRDSRKTAEQPEEAVLLQSLHNFREPVVHAQGDRIEREADARAPAAEARVAAELDVVDDRGLQRPVAADAVEEVATDQVEDASPPAEDPRRRDVHEPAG